MSADRLGRSRLDDQRRDDSRRRYPAQPAAASTSAGTAQHQQQPHRRQHGTDRRRHLPQRAAAELCSPWSDPRSPGTRRRARAARPAAGSATDAEGQTITLINSTITGNVARDVGPNNARGGGIYVGNRHHADAFERHGRRQRGGRWRRGRVRRGRRDGHVREHDRRRERRRCLRRRRRGDPGELAPQPRLGRQLRADRPRQPPGRRRADSAAWRTTAARPTRGRSPRAARRSTRAAAAPRRTSAASPAQGAACDIGAFEYVAPTLTVTTTVTNNDGGEDRPADFSVRVTLGRRRRRRQPAAGQLERHDLHAGARHLRRLGQRA